MDIILDTVKNSPRHAYYSLREWKLYRSHGCKPGLIHFFK